ncbi:transcriptional regulator, ArsR family [Fervidobacterium gondwanense DSM 13020]|uniref:Transcriptional regulator, ArsR family n=1 Tax=Fervidobacterium gondwanense DSM 13020 TaxID=1121883 RepID=A0A1M7TCA2_FERGO|nr:transcriptional regulator, ArsR family [Fervidobacterium gondwanense DSM 13020]
MGLLKNEELLRHVAEFFNVLSDETRLKIINSLMDDEKTVSEIVLTVGISQSAVSHQLRLLRQFGIVKYRKVGKYVYYSIDDEHVEKVINQAFEHIEHKNAKE